VFSSGIWKEKESLESPHLQFLAKCLPKVVESAYAGSTLIKYKASWDKWLNWAKKFPEVSIIPADPFIVCLYFNELLTENAQLGAITSAFCGIRWGHISAGLDTPTNHPFVKLCYSGALKQSSERRPQNQRKEPFTPDMIKDIIKAYGSTNNLVHLRFIIVCLLGFSGFLRISELLNLKIGEMAFQQKGLEMTISKSKTDKLREGNIVYIAKTGTLYCPVFWTKKYIVESKLNLKRDNFLICRTYKTKHGHICKGEYSLSYSRVRENFLELLAPITKEKTQHFGLHSLRSGGATAAANNSVTDRLIGKHGRWSSNSSRDTYIKDSKKIRFSVTKNLGL